MKRRTKFLLICLGAVAVLAVLIAVHHFRVKSKVEHYKAGLRARGEVFEWEKLLGEPTPPELNGASLFKDLSSRLPQNGVLATNTIYSMQMVARGKAMAGWAQPWVGDLSTEYSNSWAEAFEDYDSQKEVITEFQRILSRPILDFNLDYSRGDRLHLTGIKGWAQRLQSASACELRRGKPDVAAAHLRALLTLVDGTAHEPLVISQLVRLAIASIAGGATWDYLQSDGLTDSELLALQNAWEDLKFLPATERALQGDRLSSLQTISDMRESSADFRRQTGWMGGVFAPKGGWAATTGNLLERSVGLVKQGYDETRAGFAEGAWRTSWSYTDELGMVRGIQSMLEVIRLAHRDGHASNAVMLLREMEENGIFPDDSSSAFFLGFEDVSELRSVFSDGVSVYTKVFSKTLQAEANARMAATAVALERYQLQHGRYPEKLDSLVPDIVANVPTDPINGEPLGYRPLADGTYLLYSVGDDLKDDGGSVEPPEEDAHLRVKHWMHGRDWVWPRPAGREEVLTYWKKEVESEFDRMTGTVLPDTSPGFSLTNLLNLLTNNKSVHDVPIQESKSEPDQSSQTMSDGEWQQFIDELAYRWTDEYFQTLTNGASELTITAPAIDQRP